MTILVNQTLYKKKTANIKMYFHFRSNGYVIFNNMRGGWVGGLHFNNQFSLVLAQRAPGGNWFTHVHSGLDTSSKICD